MACEYIAAGYDEFPGISSWTVEDVVQCHARYTNMYRSNRIVRTCGPFLSLSYLHYKSWEKYPHTGTNPVSKILAIMYLSPIDSFDWALINRLICEDRKRTRLHSSH